LDLSNGKLVLREIGLAEISDLELFYTNLVEGKKSFRYFDKRPFEIISNHLVTLLLYEGAIPIGYGHLDNEQDKVWLGVAVADAYVAQGLGKILVKSLIQKADFLELKKIQLAVDATNLKAISLYKKQGFELLSSNENFSIFELSI
jgi:ribosomal protein S18 acetylase RimI-like enzyme